MENFTVEQIKELVSKSEFLSDHGKRYEISHVNKNVVMFLDSDGNEFGYTFEKLTEIVNKGNINFYKMVKVEL